MNYFIDNLKSEEELLQGDIFQVKCTDSGLFNESEKLAMMLTADCDISNKKMGEYYTVIPIVSAKDYLETYWLDDFFLKESEKIIGELASIFNMSEIYEAEGYDPITNDKLSEWLKEDSLDNIFLTHNLPNKSELVENYNEKLNIINKDRTLTGFVKYKKSNGAKAKGIKKEIEQALNKCRDEFYYLPNITMDRNYGLVMKLREIKPVHKNKVFTNNVSARLSNEDGDLIIRVGRFSDYLKYSVSQSFSLLFSRIGLPMEFEKDKVDSIEIITTEIMECYDEC